MWNIKIYLFTTLKKLCAIIGYRSTKYLVSFSKVPVKLRKLNQQNIVLYIKLEHLLNQYWRTFVLIFWCSCFMRFLCFCYLASFWEYRLDSLRIFSVSQLQAWECLQVFTNGVCFYCIAPGFCSKQYQYFPQKNKNHFLKDQNLCKTLPLLKHLS